MSDEVKECPKCGKNGIFGFFEVADEKGIIGMFSHSKGIKPGLFGNVELYDRCYLTEEELKLQPWYETWQSKRQKHLEDEKKRMQKEEDYQKTFIE